MCVTATDRFQQTKLGLYCHKYRGDKGGEEEAEGERDEWRGEEGKEEE